MRLSRAMLFVSMVVATTVGCGDFGDSDLETEVGEESNNGGPGPIDGFSEERDIAVGAKHLITPTDGTRMTVAIPSNPDIVNVPSDVGEGNALEIKCVTAGSATIDINLESTSSSQTVAGEFVANCIEPENLVLSPIGYEILGTTRRQPYQSRIVTADPEMRIRYDLFAQESRLAGYAYDPFNASEGLEYTSRPQSLSASAPASSVRFLDVSVDQSVAEPTAETVFGRELPVDVITTDTVERIVFTDVSGAPVEAGSEDLSGALIQTEGMYMDEPVYGLAFELASQTPDVCEVVTMDEVTGEEGDVNLPLFQVARVAPGTCEITAGLIDGGDLEGSLTFEVTE